MYSGKTSLLISRLLRETYAKRKVQVFKPVIDDRFHKTRVVSHAGTSLEATPVHYAGAILELVDKDTVAVGIDECQFFGVDIIETVNELARRGVRVICAGLDLDYRGLPFGHMPTLLSISEYVEKPLAVCMKCGNPANRTQRITQGSELVLIGDIAEYEARCRRCHVHV